MGCREGDSLKTQMNPGKGAIVKSRRAFLILISLLIFSWLLSGTHLCRAQGTAAPSEPNLSSGSSLQIVQLESVALKGNLLGDPTLRDILVYLPPSYHQNIDRRYPVIYLLHGFSSDHLGYTPDGGPSKLARVRADLDLKLDIQDISDSLIASGSIAEFIIVTPNANNRYGGSNYESNPVIGDYRTFVTSELVHFIDSRYRVLASRESRGIAGHSMGGQGALILASDFPEVYGAVAALSPAHNDLKPASSQGLPGLLQWFNAIGGGKLPTPVPWKDLKISDEDFVTMWGRSGAESRVAVNFVYAAAASFSPNPNNPPFFADLPLEYSGGIPRLVTSVWNQWKVTDLVSHIRGSRANLAYTAIYVNRGTFVAPNPNIKVGGEIADITSTVRALDEAGLVFEYETFPGDHFSGLRFQVEQALRFFTRKLRARSEGQGEGSQDALTRVRGRE